MKTLLGLIAAGVAVLGMANVLVFASGRPPLLPLAVSHPLALLAFGYLFFALVFPRFLYRSRPAERQRAVQQLQASGGAVLATTRCGGRLGSLNFSGPLLGVTVYQGGLLIKPVFMPPIALFSYEIRAVYPARWWFSSVTTIAHSSAAVASPIRLMDTRSQAVQVLLGQYGLPPGAPIPPR